MSDKLPIVTNQLNNDTADLVQKIVDSTDPTEVKDLTRLFNLHQAKKNVVRMLKLNDLLDTVSDKIVERFEKTPDNFSNDDLIKYMQVTENAIEKTGKTLGIIEEAPTIQITNNTQVNVNALEGIDREARARIQAVISAAMAQKNNNTYIDEEKSDES